MKKITVIGAGISGLATAYYFKKAFPNAEIKIFEANKTCGGKISTVKKDGFIFEEGPRGIRPSGKGRHFLQFAREIGLWEKLVPSNKEAKIRYIFLEGKLEKLPSNPIEAITSKTTSGTLKAILQDLTTSQKTSIKDETIYDFIERRLGSEIANKLIDPVISGVYAGNIKKLSANETIYFLTEPEKNFGGIIKGLIKQPKTKPEISENFGEIEKSALVTFEGGMQTLIDRLSKLLEDNLVLGSKLTKIQKNGEKFVLDFGESVYEADFVFSTLPSYELAKIVDKNEPVFLKLTELLGKIIYAPISVTSLGYENKVNKFKGFGYLVPHREKQKILGALWNDQIFNGFAPKGKSSFSVMLGGACDENFSNFSEKDFIEMAENDLQKHLSISENPGIKMTKIWVLGIPQYNVGHKEIVGEIQNLFENSNFVVSGNFVGGVSVIDCVRNAKNLVGFFEQKNKERF
ncbi:protoporphyrinogen oxidase [bacterium]|nr:protoporphyrinogen oxidase [bacterium]